MIRLQVRNSRRNGMWETANGYGESLLGIASIHSVHQLRKSSSSEFVRCNYAMPPTVVQITSQSPAFATWHSLLPVHLPVNLCMLCLRLNIRRESVEFSTMRSTTDSNSDRFHFLFVAFFLRSRLEVGVNAARSRLFTTRLSRSFPAHLSNVGVFPSAIIFFVSSMALMLSALGCL